MKAKLLIANHLALLACCSMYFGTGWSLWLFSFPIAPQLTPENYFLQFVPQVEAATRFLTPLTILMFVLNIIMIVAEWRRPTRWLPIIAFVALIAATALTKYGLFPYNEEMAKGIRDAGRLQEVLGHWIGLNKIRVSLWTVQWLCIAGTFAYWARKGRYAE